MNLGHYKKQKNLTNKCQPLINVKRDVVNRLRQFCAFYLLTCSLLMHSRKHCTVYFTAFFSVMWKKIWNQIWIPQTIFYKVILTSTIYHVIWRHKQWFSDYYSLFLDLHQISRAKKHDTGHSDQRSSRLWVNIRIWDEFRATTRLFIAVCIFWHFFLHLNLLDFPLASCLIMGNKSFFY